MGADIRAGVRAALAQLRTVPGVATRPGVDEDDLELLELRLGCYLPAVYKELLRHTNGLEVADGCRRWLGYGPDAPMDVVWWNDPATWKWAYTDLCPFDPDQHVIFQVDAFGLGTVCRRDDLQHRDPDPEFLTSSWITPAMAGGHPLSVTLGGTVGIAQHPRRDGSRHAILDTFGTVPADQLVLHSPFASGPTDMEGAVLLPAPTAMVGKADLLRHQRQLAAGGDQPVEAIEQYTDGNGRQRLRFKLS